MPLWKEVRRELYGATDKYLKIDDAIRLEDGIRLQSKLKSELGVTSAEGF